VSKVRTDPFTIVIGPERLWTDSISVNRYCLSPDNGVHSRGMKILTVDEAQRRLPELVGLVVGGEEVELVEQDTPVARLVPAEPPSRVQWSETWTRVNQLFQGAACPGTPGSKVVLESRR